MKYNTKIVQAWFVANHLPTPILEYKFSPERRWRFDFAWEIHKVALEVQGGLFVRGGHNRGGYMIKEHEKRNAAAGMGWRILYCQPSEVLTTDMVKIIRKALQCL